MLGGAGELLVSLACPFRPDPVCGVVVVAVVVVVVRLLLLDRWADSVETWHDHGGGPSEESEKTGSGRNGPPGPAGPKNVFLPTEINRRGTDTGNHM